MAHCVSPANLRRVASFVVATCLLCTPVAAQATFREVLFRPGDDAARSARDYDDRAWQPLLLPQPPRLTEALVGEPVGWFRWHWRVPDDFACSRPAVSLGVIVNSDELFFDGEPVGSTGRIARWHVTPPWLPRIYEIPADRIRPGSEHVFALRVFAAADAPRLACDHIVIGDLADLRSQCVAAERTQLVGEISLLTFYALVLIAWAALYAVGVRTPECRTIGPWLICFVTTLLGESRLLHDFGWDTPQTERLYLLAAGLAPLLSLRFAAALFRAGHEPRRAGQRPLTAVTLLLIGGLAFGDLRNRTIHGGVLALYVATAVASAGLIFAALVHQVRRLARENGILLAGIVAGIAGILPEAFVDTRFHSPIGVSVANLGAVAFVIAAMITLAQHYRRETKSVAAAILASHDDERRRIGREIHDGVGQSLMAIKLGLQMQNARRGDGAGDPSAVSLAGLIAEVDSAIDELRAMASELRPTALEHQELGAALRVFAERLRSRTKTAVELHCDADPPLAPHVKDNLYRVCQEAVKNALQHAAARTIHIALRQFGGKLRLEIRDDGHGFDPRRPSSGSGLSTMRERAELLGGSARITSSPTAGTHILVEVPVVAGLAAENVS